MGFGNINFWLSLDELFSLFYKFDVFWNEFGWNNLQFDQLLINVRGEGDEIKRKQMYWDMQELIFVYCGVSVLVFMNFIDGFDK